MDTRASDYESVADMQEPATMQQTAVSVHASIEHA